MKKLLTIFLICFVAVSIAYSADNSLKFAWEHDGVDVAFFRLYFSQTAGGPYTQLVDIPYTAGATQFVSTVPFTIPDGSDQTWYFVMTAIDASANESDNSNEASIRIDTAPPSNIMNLTVEIVVQ